MVFWGVLLLPRDHRSATRSYEHRPTLDNLRLSCLYSLVIFVSIIITRVQHPLSCLFEICLFCVLDLYHVGPISHNYQHFFNSICILKSKWLFKKKTEVKRSWRFLRLNQNSKILFWWLIQKPLDGLLWSNLEMLMPLWLLWTV